MVIKKTPVLKPEETHNGQPGGVEVLIGAQLVNTGTIDLEFADGRRFSLPIEQLQMPLDRIQWHTIARATDGTCIHVNDIKDEAVSIDAKTLRYLADPEYAKRIDSELKQLQFTEEELERIAKDNPPPPEWFSQPSRDLTRESWK